MSKTAFSLVNESVKTFEKGSVDAIINKAMTILVVIPQ